MAIRKVNKEEIERLDKAFFKRKKTELKDHLLLGEEIGSKWIVPELTEDYLEEVRELAASGVTDRQLAMELGLRYRLFRHMKENFVDFAEAINQGKDEINNRVEQAMVRMATGYWKKEEDFSVYRGALIKKTINKYYPPNPYAAYKWLVNRDKERWTEKKTVEENVNLKVYRNIDMSDFSEAELKALEKVGMQNMLTQQNNATIRSN